jgi:hypothetical protein
MIFQESPCRSSGLPRAGVRHFVLANRKTSRALLLGVLLLVASASAARAQDSDPAVKENQQKARQILDAMVQALGGDAWLHMQNRVYEGRRSGFYQGKPTGGIVDYWEFHQFPDKDRIEFTKKRDVVQIFIGQEGWEVTYRGKRQLPADQLEKSLLRRDHSIETAIKVWLKDPGTILFYDGQRTVQRHLADQVKIISPANDSITIQTDAESHLPVRRSFQWRDAVYKDKNESSEEYDDYHAVGGFQTPFTITSYLNDEMTDQRFLFHASYNVQLPPDTFDVDATATKIKK